MSFKKCFKQFFSPVFLRHTDLCVWNLDCRDFDLWGFYLLRLWCLGSRPVCLVKSSPRTGGLLSSGNPMSKLSVSEELSSASVPMNRSLEEYQWHSIQVGLRVSEGLWILFSHWQRAVQLGAGGSISLTSWIGKQTVCEFSWLSQL